MDTGMEVIIFLAYAAGLLIIFLLGKFFALSGKWILKAVLNSFCGGVILIAINLIGAGFGVHLPVNLLTGFGIGTLGIPGILLLYFISG
ncbi:SigmaK-factor processing regulatory BofA [Aminipila butyrica]|uniref:SigmaK-factor processing regulatory BofA n=1 Tax=Aminipila butyrica TaxID=433296 RepID=A0A858BXP6_9FIRM|nr:pro-sigmaK processing inhibitor BofA family protein [Aminipila butyrica]QIB70202.1 SigmaK-factor processing regulatory BofA [Aminipila butyrica]